MKKKFFTLGETVEYLESVKNRYYFRGYKYFKQKKPALGRETLLISHEFEMLREIACSQEIEEFSNVNTFQQLFEYLQHYSFKTRLLDWSMDPFVGLYFSVFEKTTIYDNKSTFIACLPRTQKKYPDLSSVPVYKPTISDFGGSHYLGDFCDIPLNLTVACGWNTVIPDFSKYLRIADKVFQGLVDQTPNISFLSYHLDEDNRNKVNQEGVFTLHRNPKHVFPRNSYDLLELCFTSAERVATIEFLKREKNITDDTLFCKEEKYLKLSNKCEEINKQFQK